MALPGFVNPRTSNIHESAPPTSGSDDAGSPESKNSESRASSDDAHGPRFVEQRAPLQGKDSSLPLQGFPHRNPEAGFRPSTEALNARQSWNIFRPPGPTSPDEGDAKVPGAEVRWKSHDVGSEVWSRSPQTGNRALFAQTRADVVVFGLTASFGRQPVDPNRLEPQARRRTPTLSEGTHTHTHSGSLL